MSSDNILRNPEPIINAVIAALETQRSGLITNWLLIILIVVIVIVVIGIIIALVKLESIQQQTDGMSKALVEATRKLALIEGEAQGREYQKLDNLAISKGKG